MLSEDIRNLYNRARIDDRQANELIGLARGLVADDTLNQKEAEYLHAWLAANKDATENPLVGLLFDRVHDYFSDGVVDDDELANLFDALKALSGGQFEVGEALKSTTLPLCDPAPTLSFMGKKFCMTGTFGFGSRADCEKQLIKLGAEHGSLTKTTNYLVIGIYATDSWAHSSYGRKIEKAVAMRADGVPIHIVSETHWVRSFN